MKNEPPLRRYTLLVIIATCVFIIMSCEGFPTRSLIPYKGKVVDADTNEPIKGAVVLGLYYYKTRFGCDSYLIDGHETLTDENGEFKLQKMKKWFILYRGYPEGSLVIFKPGYGEFPEHPRSSAIGIKDSSLRKLWPQPGKYIVYDLPMFKNIEERKKAYIDPYPELPYKYKKLYLDALNQERVFFGYEPFPVPK